MVPGTAFTTASISFASFSISSRSLPNTLMPIGVRMPVESMSMRALIGMVQELATPGNLQRLVQFGDQLVDGHAGSPFGFRLEVDDGLEHFQRRRVGGGVGATGLAEDRRHLGEGLDDLVLGLQQSRRPW